MTSRFRRSARGFTLVELMVALAMGLIVGMTVVALSKEVTNTFHEEARIISAESGLRTAMDRLRADIARASMMSTANFQSDPAATLALSTGTLPPYLLQMAGIRIMPKGSTNSSTGWLMAPNFPGTEDKIPEVNGLAPDAIEITGNLSPNADYYSVQTQTLGVGCGSQRLIISNTDAAYRVGSIDGGPGVPADRALRLMFIPDASATSTGLGHTFFARIQDRNSTKIPLPQQYVLVCDAGYLNGNLYVDLAGTTSLSQTSLGEGMIINPIHTVRWRIAKSPTNGSYATIPINPTNDPNKYDLIRTYVDSTGTEVGVPDNAAGEVVAEYMVDMKFAGTVDTTPAGNQDAGPVMTTLPFDDGGIEQWAGVVTAVPTANRPSKLLPPTSPAPQRVRSLSVRLSSRAAIPDRAVNILPDPSNPTSPYMYRYAVGDAGHYARVRTLISEVMLINQGNATYP